ncbi:hypothetical protein IV203_029018 [Nitzschia inconspicua]|uniref:Calcineurin-like phosphoesterase domain-containing protein n=1 Tax=Nitzschia inconspicua TaxID=303405 RepID=A0A9K3LQX9_9STRA|nr:hypothetical protein IV203_029018 [Nitzschia inconspicua]
MVTPVLSLSSKSQNHSKKTLTPFAFRCRQQHQLLAVIFSLCVIFLIFYHASNHVDMVLLQKEVHEKIYPLPDGSQDYNLLYSNSTKTSSFAGFSFYLMGDTPYRDWQETRLEWQVKQMKQYTKNHPERNLTFTVHVGDIQKVSLTHCAESAYQTTANLLRQGPLPTLVVPGDNDYYDCPDRNATFQLFMKYFGSFEKQWHKKDVEGLGLIRSESHPELFVFVKEGILLIGLHLINAPESHEDIRLWNARMIANKEWVAKNVQHYFRTQEIRGVILLGHALRSPRTRPFFLTVADYFVNITHRQDLPVVYLHGDGHNWDVDTKLSHQLHWKHFRDIQVDQGGLADPVIVEFAPQIKGKLKAFKDESSDLQLVLGKGLIRLDRQNGLYKHPKNVKNLLK